MDTQAKRRERERVRLQGGGAVYSKRRASINSQTNSFSLTPWRERLIGPDESALLLSICRVRDIALGKGEEIGYGW